MAENPYTPQPPISDHEVADLFVGKLDIPNLEDAQLADSPYSKSCTLILTEGDSAKNFARSGDKYGVFPLEGKLLNVRDASRQELQQNAELQNIKKILGLRYGKIYEAADKLRYGHLMIMANKGHDSLHIIGLLIKFLHYFWPTLLQVKKNFLRVCIIPIIKATCKKTNEVSLFYFYTMKEYQDWQENLGNKVAEYKIEYFEWPETIESEERAEYLDQHVKDFVWMNIHDRIAFEMAFGYHINDWLRTPMESHTSSLDSTAKRIRYENFINVDFKQYVMADLQRSIPSMVDGLKPGQRKILYYAFKKPIIQEIEVDQFCAYVFEHSPYHHGEESLVGTIIGMAQNFVGSNNINLLQPNGQFGTRLMGGKYHDASGRCLYTQLSPITRYLFPEDDQLLLGYMNEDQSIEPECFEQSFLPIIPMVLVNGSEGRGTVGSSFIPNYNPRDIISNLKRLLNDEELQPMHPWYNGFKGDIEKTETSFYTTKGMKKDNKNGITITELPVGMWTYDYEESLKAASLDYTARHGHPNNVHFEITMTENQMESAKEKGLFELTTTLSTANMLLFSSDKELVKFFTPEDILRNFFYFRRKSYEQRRLIWIVELNIALLFLENKLEFINQVCKREILLFTKKPKEERCAELKEKGFLSSQSIAERKAQLICEQKLLSCYPKVTFFFENPKVTEEEELRTGYDYLLSTPIESFLNEKMEELGKEIKEKKNKLCEFNNSSPGRLWLKDLDALICQLDAENYPSANAAGQQRANKKRKSCM